MLHVIVIIDSAVSHDIEFYMYVYGVLYESTKPVIMISREQRLGPPMIVQVWERATIA